VFLYPEASINTNPRNKKTLAGSKGKLTLQSFFFENRAGCIQTAGNEILLHNSISRYG
jgi:hypothetical protein